MQDIQQNIKNLFLSLWAARTNYFNVSILQLENHHKRVHSKGSASLKDGLIAALFVIKIILSSVQIYAIMLGMILVVTTTGPLIAADVEMGAFRPIFAFFFGVLAVTVSLAVYALLHPLNLLLHINTSILFTAQVIVSSALIGQSETSLQFIFQNEKIYLPPNIFVAMLGIYSTTYIIILLQFYPIFDFGAYQKRHSMDFFFSILPAEKRGPIISISAQDHYVNIVTEKGSHLHRMSMTEAIKNAPSEEGQKVHRSHWVANRVMRSLEATGGRYYVVLQDGNKIPVSKSKLPAVRDVLKDV